MANELIIDAAIRLTRQQTEDIAKRLGDTGRRAGAEFSEGINASFKTIALGNLAANAISSAIASISNAARESVTSLRDFSRSIAEVNSILPANQKLTENSTRALIDFSSQFGSDTSTQARAFYNIVSAGVQGTAKQLSTLETANKAAVAGLVDIDSSAKLLVSSVNAYSKSGLTAEQASDRLFAAVREGQTTFAELSGFLGNVTGIAASAGLEFSELTGSIAAFTKQGLGTDIAVTGLRQVLVSVVKPTKEAQDEAKRLGINFSTAGLQAKGFANFIREISQRTNNSSASIAKLFGNVRALTPILTTVNGNFSEFERILQSTAKSSGDTATALAEISKNLDFRIRQKTQELKNFAQVITDAFVKTFGKAAASAIADIDTISRKFVSIGRIINDNFIAGVELAFNIVRDVAEGVLNTITTLAASAADVLVKTLQSTLSPLLKTLNIGKSITEGIDRAAEVTKEVLESNISSLKGTFDNTFDGTVYGKTAEFLDLVEKNAMGAKEIIESSQPVTPTPPIQSSGGGENANQGAANTIGSLSKLFGELGTAIGATEKEADDASKGIANRFSGLSKAALKIGQDIKKGIGGGIGGAFSAFGAALVNGENAFSAFAKSFLSTLGQMMVQQGTAFILQGLGFSVIPGLQASGGTLLAAGAGLAALGGALSAIGGSAAPTPTTSAGGGFAVDAGLDSDDEQEPEAEFREPDTNVSVVFNGDIIGDGEESGLKLVNLLNQNFESQGLVFKGARTV